MSIAAKLDDLFERWKAVQLQEAEALGLAHPDWFFPDGLVGEEAAYRNAPVKVLYILKESNINGPPKDFGFWFKRIAADGTKHIIKRRIQLMQQVVTGSDDLSVTAYMNLNKSGGTNRTNHDWLRTFAQHPAIAPLIQEQIGILAPDVIVCCGCHGLVRGILGENAPGRLVDMWHPSDHFKSDADYVAKFTTEWENGT